MTNKNGTISGSIIINHEGEFSAQFSELKQQVYPDEEDVAATLQPGYSSVNIEVDPRVMPVSREGNFPDQFSKLGAGDGLGTLDGIRETLSRTNLKPENAIDSQYASVERSGNVVDEFSKFGAGTDLGIPDSIAVSQLRGSFTQQLQSLNEIDSDSDSVTYASAVSNGPSIIKHRMRRSAVGFYLSKLFGLADLETLITDDKKAAGYEGSIYEDLITDPVFISQFPPHDMRCLAIVAHNHMKPAMKTFILANKNLLCKFTLTGTSTTMMMLREVFGNDSAVKYGPTCSSGPLGGDAELVAIMCTENLGGIIFFQDPMSSHPHTADIECLTRQANVHNVLMMPNPATAHACMESMRIALKHGRAEIIPSFFKTLSSPSVAEFKIRQAQGVKIDYDMQY